jgi:hypothetical protein
MAVAGFLREFGGCRGNELSSNCVLHTERAVGEVSSPQTATDSKKRTVNILAPFLPPHKGAEILCKVT